MQGDYGIPIQFSYDYFKYLGFKKTIIKLIKFFISFRKNQSYSKNLTLDDYEILKLTGAKDLLIRFPAHKNIFFDDCFFLEKNISTTPRWSRYLYIANKIKKKILNNESTWLDIGSYYGGLQSIIKKIYPNITLFMVDFDHQLLRSYIYLKKLFPENEHLIFNKKNKINFEKLTKGSIIYLNPEDFEYLNTINFNLISNFFSFGEMIDSEFERFYHSNIMDRAENIYLCNRFVSAPFFEKTYNNKINILSYLKKNFKVEYLDVFPIHNYSQTKRKLFGRSFIRPYSSQGFELHLKKNENKF